MPSSTALPGLPSWACEPLDPAQGLGRHRDDWDALNERLFGGHPLLDAGFVDALLRHFGEPGLHLCTASQGGARPQAMTLLKRQNRGLGIWSSFLPMQAQIAPALMTQSTPAKHLLKLLPAYATQLDLLCNDPRFGDLRGQGAHVMPHALTMSVSLAGGFDDYLAQRPRKLMQNMRRYLRRLQSEGGRERVDVVTAPELMAAAVDRYAALESRGWKGRKGTAVRSDNAQGRFYADVMRCFAERGEAMVYELWLGEDLLASRMMLSRGGMTVMLKTAFDENFERFAPGRILLLRTLEDLFKRTPGGVVEFYTDAEADLLAWSTSQRWINHVSVYRHRGLPWFYELLRRGGRSWKRRGQERPLDVTAMAQRSGATVERFAHPRELPEDALALLRRREQAYVEFGADWFGLLCDTVFRDASQTSFHVLRRQGRTLAVLPIAKQQGESNSEVGALANYYTTLYSPALEEDLAPEDLLPLVLALRREHGAPAYRFWPMDPATREFELLREALRLAGLRPHAYFAFGNWYLQVEGDWAGYLKNRSGQLRSTIKRMTKRLAAEDGGRLEIIRDEADMERGIAAYQAVYDASWKVPEPYVDFIPGLIRLCARRGWLRLGVAWIGDKPIAAQLWIVNAGRAHIYKVAYDEAFKAIAPGTLVTALLLEEAIDRDKVAEVDYLIGDDAYKKTWMSHRRERFGLIAYDPATPRGLYGLLRQAVGNTWRRLRALRTPPALPADNPAS
ncbi:CelD/BcsL family acetyltransferase involved in cellulose biosynthesis [Pelomonas aquatica]|uniref:CelD/BcsL family acetyltransferase involved in cellulose biosynthesis n=1 Tax=Pelomonas aquatica TaxID=431058 RepID=A0ABU1Z3H6_9BURK|nr:GNAT family N-acetyltransferase [Pelomonas aquatica]MDR7295153.1 CelD/BcsL family acetyltransferase involved in cellulose biosynthesis [Pelomonas aquatica]